jgi:hypothetical protein
MGAFLELVSGIFDASNAVYGTGNSKDVHNTKKRVTVKRASFKLSFQ